MLKKEWMRLAIERGDALEGLRESYVQLETENEVLVELIHRMMFRFDLIGEMDEYFGNYWREMDANIKNVIVQRNVTFLGGE